MIWLLVAIVVGAAFAAGGLMGAPYVPILKRDSQKLIELANMKPGQTLIDLGCGDGRLLRAAAAQNAHAIGYEINPFMVLIARLACWRQRRLITIRWANFWKTTLPPA